MRIVHPFAALAAAAVLAPATAGAHEVLHQIDRSRAIAVRAYESDGEALAGQPFEVYSPADGRAPHLTGRTDRAGWLAFVPDAPGRWRVKVVDETGHGLDLEIDAAAATAPPPAAAPSSAAFVLRPLVGVAAVAAVFGLLVAVYRRGGRRA